MTTQLVDEAAAGADATAESAQPSCCDHCGAHAAELLWCTGCDAAFYCTTECQHSAWFDLLLFVVCSFMLFTG
jgi:hypothetical protein